MNEKSILIEADEIVNKRSQEKERQYGPFNECMERAAKIYNVLANKNITAKEMYYAMIAQKLARESYSHKRDNLLDAVGYIQALENYENYENGE